MSPLSEAVLSEDLADDISRLYFGHVKDDGRDSRPPDSNEDASKCVVFLSPVKGG